MVRNNLTSGFLWQVLLQPGVLRPHSRSRRLVWEPLHERGHVRPGGGPRLPSLHVLHQQTLVRDSTPRQERLGLGLGLGLGLCVEQRLGLRVGLGLFLFATWVCTGKWACLQGRGFKSITDENQDSDQSEFSIWTFSQRERCYSWNSCSACPRARVCVCVTQGCKEEEYVKFSVSVWFCLLLYSSGLRQCR